MPGSGVIVELTFNIFADMQRPGARLGGSNSTPTRGGSPARYSHVNESKLSKTGKNLACHIASHGLTLGAIMYGVQGYSSIFLKCFLCNLQNHCVGYRCGSY